MAARKKTGSTAKKKTATKARTTKKKSAAKKKATTRKKAVTKKKTARPAVAKKKTATPKRKTSKSAGKKAARKTASGTATKKAPARKATAKAPSAKKAPSATKAPSAKKAPVSKKASASKATAKKTRKKAAAPVAAELDDSPPPLPTPGRAVVVFSGTKEHNKLGEKWTCFSCGARFYDLGRDDKRCPKCGADQADKPKEGGTPAPKPAKRKTRRAARPMAPLLEEDDDAVRYNEEFDMGIQDSGSDEEERVTGKQTLFTETPDTEDETESEDE